MKNIKEFFTFARERERVRIARQQGKPWPWTKDKILLDYRFCNVFRRDDKVSRWIFHNLTLPLSGEYCSPNIIPALVAGRFFNRISTLEALRPMLIKDGWNSSGALKILRRRAPPYVTGAYIVKAPPGMKKIEGIAQIIAPINKDKNKLFELLRYDDTTLKCIQTELLEYPYMGKFMTYEVVSDLRWAQEMVGTPTDIMTWANAGPGAARGLGWLYYSDPKRLNYHSDAQQEVMLVMMRDILAKSRLNSYWPHKWKKPWELREVEHTLCEYWKYARCKYMGQRLKQRYRAL